MKTEPDPSASLSPADMAAAAARFTAETIAHTWPDKAVPLPTLPSEGYCRRAQIRAVLPVSDSEFDRLMASGFAPRPIKLSKRVALWKVEEVRAMLAAIGSGKAAIPEGSSSGA